MKKINVLQLFYFLLSLAIVSRIICDINLFRIGIHFGDVVPIRKFNPDSAPYSIYFLFLEFSLALVGAVLLNLKKVRLAAVLITVSYLMGLTQMYHHQKILIFFTVTTIAILPLSVSSPSSIWFLRCQLIIVYGYSFLHKFLSNFFDGKVLMTILNYHQTLETNLIAKKFIAFSSQPEIAKILAITTLLLELLIPILLIRRPKTGVAFVIVLHLSMNIFMNDIFPFGVTMIALSLLFLLEIKDQPQMLDN